MLLNSTINVEKYEPLC